MKQQLKKWMTAAAILLVTINASAQNERKEDAAPWVSSKGYWVIETNTKTPLQHTVRFYTNEDSLVYTEKVEGIRLNPERRKIKMKLKEVLETSVTAWERNKIPEVDKNYVTTVLK